MRFPTTTLPPLHDSGARLQRAGSGRRPDRRHGCAGISAATSCRCCCCWRPTTTSRSAAAQACGDSDAITIVLVPPAEPRTKPKACNYGLHFATGDIVTIYDAEDLPEPLQLRRVVAAFGRLPDDVACVQAKLGVPQRAPEPADRLVHRRVRTVVRLPAAGHDAAPTSPIPLGGTSNHLRETVLDEIGAWDPFNVTEDADLGLRIAASGYHTAVIDSEHAGGGQQRPDQLDPAALALVQGLPADLAGAHPTTRDSCCAPSDFAASSGSTWCWPARRSSRCSTWCSG